VIATSSSGRRFAALARYLLHGRSGEETERVAWTAGGTSAIAFRGRRVLKDLLLGRDEEREF
jgi:hypothetical protein